MKKIPITPFARSGLGDQQSYLLWIDPEAWPEHLQHAFQIVNERAPQVAEQIVIDAVGAAYRAVRKSFESQLKEARASALAAFSKNCKEISNAMKPRRMLKAVRMKFDVAARSAFVCGFADLETVERFFSECEIARKRGITLSYEACPSQFRLECESALTRLISEKAKSISAHDVFAVLHEVSLLCAEKARSEREQNLLQEYLGELDAIWASYGLKVGRGNHHADSEYRGPFPEFAERVLLSQRNPGSNFFEPLSEQESETVRRMYWAMHPDWQKATTARPFRDAGLITDRTLRNYLDLRDSKKSG
jgi:hypothetical protein